MKIHTVVEMQLHPAKCTLWYAISRQGIIGLNFVKGTIIKQQQLQNEVIKIIQVIHKAGQVDKKFTRRMVHAHIQQMLPWISCIRLVTVSCQINNCKRVFQMWVVMVTMFTGHKSPQLFPLELPQRSCVPHQPAECSGVASSN
jgi:hypothetical protein